MLNEFLLNILFCPYCKSSLSIINKEINCSAFHTFRIKNNILDFNSKKTESLFLQNKINNTYYDKIIQQILSIINKSNFKNIVLCAYPLDSIAQTLINGINKSVNIILADTDFNFLNSINSTLKNKTQSPDVNFIAYDGSELPVEDYSIDCVINLSGINNIMNDGFLNIKEYYRILKNKGIMINIFNTQLFINQENLWNQVVKQMLDLFSTFSKNFLNKEQSNKENIIICKCIKD